MSCHSSLVLVLTPACALSEAPAVAGTPPSDVPPTPASPTSQRISNAASAELEDPSQLTPEIASTQYFTPYSSPEADNITPQPHHTPHAVDSSHLNFASPFLRQDAADIPAAEPQTSSPPVADAPSEEPQFASSPLLVDIPPEFDSDQHRYEPQPAEASIYTAGNSQQAALSEPTFAQAQPAEASLTKAESSEDIVPSASGPPAETPLDIPSAPLREKAGPLNEHDTDLSRQDFALQAAALQAPYPDTSRPPPSYTSNSIFGFQPLQQPTSLPPLGQSLTQEPNTTGDSAVVAQTREGSPELSQPSATSEGMLGKGASAGGSSYPNTPDRSNRAPAAASPDYETPQSLQSASAAPSDIAGIAMTACRPLTPKLAVIAGSVHALYLVTRYGFHWPSIFAYAPFGLCCSIMQQHSSEKGVRVSCAFIRVMQLRRSCWLQQGHAVEKGLLARHATAVKAHVAWPMICLTLLHVQYALPLLSQGCHC